MYSEGFQPLDGVPVLDRSRGRSDRTSSHAALAESCYPPSPSHMTSEGARRAPCTDCETVIRQSAVVPQYRTEGDVPETVGRVHRLCIHIEGVHSAKETA